MIFLGLGSNIGDRIHNLQRAVTFLADHSQITIVKKSSVYETEPVGYTDQPLFLNMVIQIETIQAPEKLLEAVLGIEKRLGRIRTVRWGPRMIDIDILVYDNLCFNMTQLSLPHPRIPERRFVLVPLCEIAADVPLYQGLTPRELLRNTTDENKVTFYRKL